MSKLPKAPLQEVIFEVRWDADIHPQTNQLFDKNFELGLGAFQTIVKSKFPITKRKTASEIPTQLLFGQVIYQFWKAEDEWPVLQIGPGLLTVNCTEKNYDWQTSYFDLIKEALNYLESAYNKKMVFTFAVLKYIDSVPLNEFSHDISGFIHKNFNFKFENTFGTFGPLKQLQFDQVFELQDESSLHLAFISSKDNFENSSFIWQTSVHKSFISNNEEVLLWCDFAHTTASSLFKSLTKQEFYDSFTT